MSANGSQKCAKFTWNLERLEAARLMAAGEHTGEEIAARVGVSRRALYKWLCHPEFVTKRDALAKAMGDIALRHAIAGKLRRIACKQQRHDKLVQVIEERAQDEEMQGIPGGKTGLVVKQVKGVGKGDDFQLVETYAVDTGTLKALSDLEKEVAEELNQVVQRHEVSGPGGKAIEHKHEHRILTDAERTSRLSRFLERARAGGTGLPAPTGIPPAADAN